MDLQLFVKVADMAVDDWDAQFELVGDLLIYVLLPAY